ncbi:hypothetical protein ElyMa_001336200 [Elysia marginata]|uniref:Uncharacterized protein n=1 Tax=Elysia marginata TaxID=1093978 RepID=A0AAV4IR54_9GAST|nr:hypothetical protein ElyMa_001336200 [Elysia marginata]
MLSIIKMVWIRCRLKWRISKNFGDFDDYDDDDDDDVYNYDDDNDVAADAGADDHDCGDVGDEREDDFTIIYVFVDLRVAVFM